MNFPQQFFDIFQLFMITYLIIDVIVYNIIISNKITIPIAKVQIIIIY